VARTMDEYVVTPALAEAFDTALGLGGRGDHVRGEQGRVPDWLVRIRLRSDLTVDMWKASTN
jgi:hypothetical protein